MPSQPQNKEITDPTLVLGFLDPTTGQLIATASIELLPASNLLRIIALKDIPEGAAACLPLNQASIAQTQSTQTQTPKFSSFDHE